MWVYCGIVGARAIRAIFVGMDHNVRGAIRAVHYERIGDDWLIHPTMSGITKWIVMHKHFPLMTEADYEEAHEHKEDVWDKIFASMGQGNAKWATGDIKRRPVSQYLMTGWQMKSLIIQTKLTMRLGSRDLIYVNRSVSIGEV